MAAVSDRQLLTIVKAAPLVGMRVGTLRAAVARGNVPVHDRRQVGRGHKSRLIDVEEVRAWQAEVAARHERAAAQRADTEARRIVLADGHVGYRRPNRHKDRCVNDHEMTGDNVRIYLNPTTGFERRICRACVREASARKRHRRASRRR